jgi:hypothetical protein
LRTDGDLNGDGVVNRVDLLQLVGNYGLGAVAIPVEVENFLAAAGSAPTPIPEPTTAALAALAFSAWLGRRRRGGKMGKQER